MLDIVGMRSIEVRVIWMHVVCVFEGSTCAFCTIMVCISNFGAKVRRKRQAVLVCVNGLAA